MDYTSGRAFIEACKAAAEAAKLDGIGRAGRNANPAWLALKLDLVRIVARHNPRFTVDDASDLYRATGQIIKTHENRAMGHVMRTAAKLGICRKAGVVKGRSITHHRGYVTAWDSLIFDPGW